MNRITTRTTIAMTALILAAFAFGQHRSEVLAVVVPLDHGLLHVPTSPASPAGASAQSAHMRFSMSVPTQGGQAGAGPVSGDMIGHLYARLTSIDRTAPLWRVTYDWTFAAGPDTFTATLRGTYDSQGRELHLSGIVDEGRLRGSRITVSATRSDIAGGHDRGTFQIHRD